PECSSRATPLSGTRTPPAAGAGRAPHRPGSTRRAAAGAAPGPRPPPPPRRDSAPPPPPVAPLGVLGLAGLRRGRLGPAERLRASAGAGRHHRRPGLDRVLADRGRPAGPVHLLRRPGLREAAPAPHGDQLSTGIKLIGLCPPPRPDPGCARRSAG